MTKNNDYYTSYVHENDEKWQNQKEFFFINHSIDSDSRKIWLCEYIEKKEVNK